jgi:hypothetical protein
MDRHCTAFRTPTRGYPRLLRPLTLGPLTVLVCLYHSSPTFAASQFKANIVPVPLTYDAANDSSGVRVPAAPANTGSPQDPTLGICSGPGTRDITCGGTCDIGTGSANCWVSTCDPTGCNFSCSGTLCDPTNPGCPLGMSCCGPGESCVPLSAPDGVTANDSPTSGHTINPKTSLCKVKVSPRGGPGQWPGYLRVDITVSFADSFDTPLAAGTDNGRCAPPNLEGTLCKRGKCARGPDSGQA